MPRLAVDIGVVPRLFVSHSVSVSSNIDEELAFSGFVGSTVLLFGSSGENSQPEYIGLSTLNSFTSGVTDKTYLQLSNIRRLRVPVERSDAAAAGKAIYEITQEMFDAIVAEGDLTSRDIDEFPGLFKAPTLTVYAAVARQLAERQHGRCSFSATVVKAGEGAAIPVKPRDLGGELHVRQCLFLHDEPAHLFNMFAWTVGPDHEIIVDSWRVGPDVLSTLNPLGKLLVADDQEWWPDETLLAWHRQKFLERLK